MPRDKEEGIMWERESGKSSRKKWTWRNLKEDARPNIADSDDSTRDDRPAGHAPDCLGSDDACEHGPRRATLAKDRRKPIACHNVAAPRRCSLTQFSSQLNDDAVVHLRVNQNRRQNIIASAERASLLAARDVSAGHTAPGGHSNNP